MDSRTLSKVLYRRRCSHFFVQINRIRSVTLGIVSCSYSAKSGTLFIDVGHRFSAFGIVHLRRLGGDSTDVEQL